MKTTLLHRLAHKLKWNKGRVESGWYGNHLWTWFECRLCGQRSGAFRTKNKFEDYKPTPEERKWIEVINSRQP